MSSVSNVDVSPQQPIPTTHTVKDEGIIHAEEDDLHRSEPENTTKLADLVRNMFSLVDV